MKITRLLVGAGLGMSLLLAGCGGQAPSESEKDGTSEGAVDEKGGDAEQPADSGETLSLKLGHAYGVSSLENRAADHLAELVEEESDGRLTIDVYPSAQLGSWEEMQEGLEFGSIDIVIESIGSLQRYTDLAAIDGVPFIYEDEEHFFRVWDGEIGDDILTAIREESGFQLLGQGYRGPRVLNSSRPVENLDDVDGLRIRVPTQQAYIDTWEALGASPTPLALDEVFTAIEQNTLEAQENPIDVVRFSSFFEVAPYVTNTFHLFGNQHFQVWGDRYDEWPSDLKAVLDDAIDETSSWYRETSLAEKDENIEFLEENGVEFFDVDREEWREMTTDIADDTPAEVQEWVQTILDS